MTPAPIIVKMKVTCTLGCSMEALAAAATPTAAKEKMLTAVIWFAFKTLKVFKNVVEKNEIVYLKYKKTIVIVLMIQLLFTRLVLSKLAKRLTDRDAAIREKLISEYLLAKQSSLAQTLVSQTMSVTILFSKRVEYRSDTAIS